MSDLSALGGSETVIAAVRAHARNRPETTAFTFLKEGEAELAVYDFATLDLKARSVAARLQRANAAGERVLLTTDPGPAYVAAFLGCSYAGATAVPCYPPRRNGRSRELGAIAADCDAAVALAAGGTATTVAERLTETAETRSIPVLDTDDIDDAIAATWTEPRLEGDDIAFLQYTSGSTGAPKGVMVRHRDIVRHVSHMYRRFELRPDSTVVSWLPPFHDMGLIAFILMPAVMGYHSVLMPPGDFVIRPARWLEAISRYRGEMVAAPNFAYDLCHDRVSDDELAALDLSSWRHACNGAEPVRAETIERFTDRFTPCGFRPETFRPCYGMAEATLAVTIPRAGARPTVIERTWDSAEPYIQGTRLVGCGVPLDGHAIAIVDPDTGERLPDGSPGEIWVTGPSVPDGYWNREEESLRTFRAALPGDEARYLRTGDMGLVHDGGLHVAGRYRDLVIVRGRNYAPSDIEDVVGTAHPRNRRGGTAVFSTSAAPSGTGGAGGERLVVVQEVRTRREEEFAAVVAAVRSRVLEEFDIAVDDVVLIRPTGLPKTTSGKIQRGACRARYLAAHLEALHTWHAEAPPVNSGVPVDTAAVRPGTVQAMEALISENIGRVLGLDPDLVERDQPFGAQGLDSVRGAEFTGNLSVLLGVSVPAAALYDHPSIRELARHLATEQCARDATGEQR
ncbi:hypothetical protein GCM10009799_51690 [Nocardiopsis rhodophaea]|uniref:Carrier domain-containing protein n=1 Tax=Nocardiopsis rhodophaea TaxID=280238 RepID=A0ABP5F696_9ACTN